MNLKFLLLFGWLGLVPSGLAAGRRPFRLDVSPHVRPGANRVTIAPFAPRSVRVIVE